MTILVTGATGLLGNNLVRQLLAQGRDVRVLVRGQADRRSLEGLAVQVHPGDVCDPNAVTNACRGASAILHAAADVRIGWTGLERQRQVNVGGTRNVVAAAIEHGVRMIHVSTIDTLGVGGRERLSDEDTPPGGKLACGYVVTKQEAEQLVMEHIPRGLEAVVVNPGFMFGPWDWKPSSGQMFLETARRFTPFAPSGGACLCDARDVAAGTLAALEHGQKGQRYILGGHNLSYLEIWRSIAAVSETRPPWGKAGPLMRWMAGSWGDLCGRLAGTECEVNSAAVGMSSLFHFYSSRRAEQELGYRIRPVVETMNDTWEWFRANGYV
jgi:dihydroflavonol-4-reductase